LYRYIKAMVLNLDNLEDSTVEVLLRELHKVGRCTLTPPDP
jgi:hypothetical protein